MYSSDEQKTEEVIKNLLNMRKRLFLAGLSVKKLKEEGRK